MSRLDLLLLSFIAIVFAGCQTIYQNPGRPGPPPGDNSSLATPSARMSISQDTQPSLAVKIGQMLMVGFRGLTVDDEHFIIQDIKERHLGGLILFDYDAPSRQRQRNVTSLGQLQALTASLQKAATSPLLIAVDQEGGVISRLKEQDGFPPTVSHGFLGGLDDPDETYRRSAALAATLAEAGINFNLAPVVDLCLNPDNPIISRFERCFSADPQAVTDHARQFIRAHRKRGVLTALKHFPGHGSSVADSHLGMADITNSWSKLELVPYRNLIGEGMADAVMTAHVYHAGRDDHWPATLSRNIVGGLLRQELGYEGLIISDDLQMGAIVKHFGLETAIEMAIAAGVDILIFANNSLYQEDIVSRAGELIRDLVRMGRITEARLDESYRRIMAAKAKMATSGTLTLPMVPALDPRVNQLREREIFSE